MPTALIIGVTGQDGSYLAEHLLSEGYRVVGLCRRLSADNHWRIRHLAGRITLIRGDVLDLPSLMAAMQRYEPDEIYNLAAQSYVAESWSQPMLTADVNALGAGRVLEAMRMVRPGARLYQASSSEMFGLSHEASQNEATPLHPRSPYGAAKAHAHHLAINYRESYGLFVACGILFNHESPRRGLEFVTRKICRGAARIHAGLDRELALGALGVARDWGFAGDYVVAMHRMLQSDVPGEYVVATGRCHTVREFAAAAFGELGLDWSDHVVTDPALRRPAEIPRLAGDAGKARRELGWEPTVDFDGLVSLMVQAEVQRVREPAELP